MKLGRIPVMCSAYAIYLYSQEWTFRGLIALDYYSVALVIMRLPLIDIPII